MERRARTDPEAKDLSELTVILSHVNGQILKHDYYMIKDVSDLSQNPAVGNDKFNKILVNTYITLLDKIDNPIEYFEAGKVQGLELLADMGRVMLEYIESNGLCGMLHDYVKERIQNNPHY